VIEIYRRENLCGLLADLKTLMDVCYPRPPQDVFYKLAEQYRIGFPVYIACTEDNRVVGFTYLVLNSKGGTLEALAVHPDFRNIGVAKKLIRLLIEENYGVIQITTRIPSFFQKFGFREILNLPDKSCFMIYTNFQ